MLSLYTYYNRAQVCIFISFSYLVPYESVMLHRNSHCVRSTSRYRDIVPIHVQIPIFPPPTSCPGCPIVSLPPPVWCIFISIKLHKDASAIELSPPHHSTSAWQQRYSRSSTFRPWGFPSCRSTSTWCLLWNPNLRGPGPQKHGVCTQGPIS